MIKTERLLLRRVRVEDAADLLAVYGDRQTMRYWSTRPDANLEESTQRAKALAAIPDPLTYFGIEYQNKLIGAAGVHEGDEIGFILNRDYWRLGIMREAVEAMLPYLLETLGTDQITADIDPRNEASAGILKALGFEKTGEATNTFCIEGEWSDSHYFRLRHPA